MVKILVELRDSLNLRVFKLKDDFCTKALPHKFAASKVLDLFCSCLRNP